MFVFCAAYVFIRQISETINLYIVYSFISQNIYFLILSLQLCRLKQLSKDSMKANPTYPGGIHANR